MISRIFPKSFSRCFIERKSSFMSMKNIFLKKYPAGVLSIFDRQLLNIKGFDKFYPNKGNNGPPKTGKSAAEKNPHGTDTGNATGTTQQGHGDRGSAKQNPHGKDKNSQGDGDKRSKWEPGKNMYNDSFEPQSDPKTVTALTILTLGLLYYLFSPSEKRKEISWHEFEVSYMEKGLVESIEIVNKQFARIKLKKEYQLAMIQQRINQINKQIQENRSTTQDGDINGNNSRQFDGSSDLYNEPPSEEEKPMFDLGQKVGRRATSELVFTIGSVDSFERKMDELNKRLNIATKDQVPIVYQSAIKWDEEIMRIIPSLLILGFLLFAMFKQGGGGLDKIMNQGKNTAKMIRPEDITVKFADVAGCDQAKKEIMEFVEFLKTPQRFEALGAKIPKGALLHGSPGTGKTLLAKATAAEAGVPFFSLAGSDFVEMFVGVGASRVRDLFKEARKNAPCIIFIDEIDAVGRARNKSGMGGNDERENTLNQLLVEMDGFDSTTNIVMLAGTNRVDMLDAALTRPGRFDRTITLELPDIKGREQIFNLHLKSKVLSGDIADYAPRLAALTPGFSGADIANICNEAAIVAGRENKTGIELTDFEQATDRVIGGIESSKLISPEEKKIVAYHEAGHAIAGWYLEHADPLLKVTIIPRGKGSLGYAQYLPKEVNLRTKEQIMDTVCMALAGRAAEQVHFGKYTTGASDDLRRVTAILYQLVQVYGMSESVGQLSFPKENNGGYPEDKKYSEQTAELMDEEVKKMITVAYDRTIALMEKHKDDVEKVATLLLQKETISHSDVSHLIGARKYSAGVEYDKFVAIHTPTESVTPKTKTTAGSVVDDAENASAEGGSSSPDVAAKDQLQQPKSEIIGDRLVGADTLKAKDESKV